MTSSVNLYNKPNDQSIPQTGARNDQMKRNDGDEVQSNERMNGEIYVGGDVWEDDKTLAKEQSGWMRFGTRGGGCMEHNKEGRDRGARMV